MTATLEISPPEPYNLIVRELFGHAAHAGSLDDNDATVFRASASESAQGAQIALAVMLDNGLIRKMRFRAWGCPYLIAAAESVCARLEQRPVSDLGDFPLQEIMQNLSIPVERTGRILLIENALQRLLEQKPSSADCSGMK